MDITQLLETVQSLPTATYMMVAIMAFGGTVIVYQILQTGFYLTMLTFPVLFMAGLVSNAGFELQGVTLSPDKGINAILAACAGIIAISAFVLLSHRLWSQAQDNR